MENKKLSVIIIGNNNIDGCLENIYKQSYINDMELIVLYKNEVEQYIFNIKGKQRINKRRFYSYFK